MTPKEYTFDAAYQPQVRAKRGTREIMLDVIIALLPALCVGVWQFGAQALIPLAVSIVSCVFFEWAYRKLMKKPDSIGDLSAVVTGILLAYTLPANCKWWLPIIGAFFAIVVVKQLYGGIGKNFLNPALAGRAFLLASYALFMTTWVVPSSLTSVIGADATTMATPLSYMKAGEALPQYFTYKSMFLGTMPGCLGEVSALALLIGGVYLLCRKVITWHIPVSFIGTVALLTLIFGSKNGGGYTHVEWMLDNLLSGGLLLGAFFMATDNTAASCAEAIKSAAKKPIIAGEEGICKACGVATLSIDYYELGRTTGEMAVKILKGEADISTMAIEYYPNPVKKYNPDMASLYNVTIPSDYEAIG